MQKNYKNMEYQELNKMQMLQVEKISEKMTENVVDKLKDHFVCSIDCARKNNISNIKIYGVFGLALFAIFIGLGFRGLELIKMLGWI